MPSKSGVSFLHLLHVSLLFTAAVSITWSKMRVLRKVHLICMNVNIGSPAIFDCIGIRLVKESGVSLASEVLSRKITDEMIGDTLEGMWHHFHSACLLVGTKSGELL